MKRRAITTLKWALTLAAVLAMTGTGWAKKKTFAPSADGQLDSTRTIATVTLSVPQQDCQDPTSYTVTDANGDTTTTQDYSYSVKAYLLQPSGRVLAIGFSDPTPPSPGFDSTTGFCAAALELPVDINAIQGLSFKPGPATVLFKVMETTTTTVSFTDALTHITTVVSTTVTTNVINEYGATVKLHP